MNSGSPVSTKQSSSLLVNIDKAGRWRPELRAVRGAVGGRLMDCGAGGAGELSGHALPGAECDEDFASGSLTLRVGEDSNMV